MLAHLWPTTASQSMSLLTGGKHRPNNHDIQIGLEIFVLATCYVGPHDGNTQRCTRCARNAKTPLTGTYPKMPSRSLLVSGFPTTRVLQETPCDAGPAEPRLACLLAASPCLEPWHLKVSFLHMGTEHDPWTALQSWYFLVRDTNLRQIKLRGTNSNGSLNASSCCICRVHRS